MSNGDLASTWMPDIEDNFTRLSAHDHDGSDSALLPASSISKYSSTISSAGYTNDGNNNYSKTVTVPAAITEINNYLVQFYVTATGIRFFPTFTRASATSYTIVLSQQLAITAVYV